MIKTLRALLNDLESLYVVALQQGQLTVAVRIKELQIKYTLCHRQKYQLEDLTDEDLQRLYLTLNGAAHESGDDALLEKEDE